MATTEDGVDLLPATIELARAEADLLTRTGREYVLRSVVEELDDYDWVLLDCPPSLGVLTVAALTAATAVLIPLQCETLSHRGVGQLLDTVHDVRRFTNRGLEVLGVLPTLYDGRTNHARAVLDTIAETYGLDVIESADPEVDPVRRGPGRGSDDLVDLGQQQGRRRVPRGRGQPARARLTADVPPPPRAAPQGASTARPDRRCGAGGCGHAGRAARVRRADPDRQRRQPR